MQILITPRLTLRPPMAPDADDIALWLSDWNVARMLAPVPRPFHVSDAMDWIEEVQTRPDDLVFTIHRERLIGVVSIDDTADEPRLGYWLGAPWHGRGYMTEAAGRLLAHVFEDRGVAAVRSSVFVDNPASLAVQRKLGFRETGIGETWSQSRQATVKTCTTILTAEAFAMARTIVDSRAVA